ncbi:uncharacterized protein LOC125208660 [Salvia hispanica]|uniref:uncharacterized protein LOC125208660 n=1 Tax=Salvia hispanica TaxID=49212 RepID=UPI00200942AB|nr:uncharacterized protein LOC125208660 [Salvia hispanica]
MMNQNNSNESRNESFEDLQVLFEEIFQSDTDTLGSSHSCVSSSEASSTSNKRNSSGTSFRKSTQLRGFCIRAEHQQNTERAAGERMLRMAGGSSRWNGWKQMPSRREACLLRYPTTSSWYGWIFCYTKL